MPKSNAVAPSQPTNTGLSMKSIFAIIIILLGAGLAFGQTDNTLYARNFPGSTVGQKVTEAQEACNPNSAMPCIIVIDPSLALYPTGTMPTKCPQCVWEDYRTGGGVANVSSVTGNSGVTCSPTTGQVGCSLDPALPNGETATTQASGDSSTKVATDQFVQNQVLAVAQTIYFGAGTAIAGSSDNTVTLSTAPINGTVALYQNGTEVSSTYYSISGSSITLQGYVFESGATVTADWLTYSSGQGGISLSNNGINGIGIRSSNSGTVNVSASTGNGTFSLPPNTQVGDLVLEIIHSSEPNANTVNFPAGWSKVNTSTEGNQWDFYKTVTASDIATDTITFNLGGIQSGGVTYVGTDFYGPGGGIGNHAQAVATSITTDTSPVVGDAVIFAAGDSNTGTIPTNTITISGATEYASVSSTSAYAVAYKLVTTAGAQTATASYLNTPNQAVMQWVVVHASGSSGTLPPGEYPTTQSVLITSNCTASGGSYSTCTNTSQTAWPKAFPDTNYAVQCFGIGPSNGSGPTGSISGFVASATKTATGIDPVIETNTSVGFSFSEVDCTANHL